MDIYYIYGLLSVLETLTEQIADDPKKLEKFCSDLYQLVVAWQE